MGVESNLSMNTRQKNIYTVSGITVTLLLLLFTMQYSAAQTALNLNNSSVTHQPEDALMGSNGNNRTQHHHTLDPISVLNQSNTMINQSGSNSSKNSTSMPMDSNPFSGNVSMSSYSKLVNDVNNYLVTKSSNPYSSQNNTAALSHSSSANKTINSNSANNIERSKLLSLHEIVIQNTSMSAPAPVRHPGQPSHEVVFALPLRNDGKIWSGTVTFTASKPIEVEVLHTYSPKVNPDSVHGKPYNAVLPGNNSIAITHLRNLVDIPIEINGTGISSGTLDFVGNALLFHKTSGEPFTVTYTIDAISKKLTKLFN